jgi:hypothetical protein
VFLQATIFRRALSRAALVVGAGACVPFVCRPLTSLRLFTNKMSALDSNPLVQDWARAGSQPYGLPPFREVEPGHFKPAFLHAIEVSPARFIY